MSYCSKCDSKTSSIPCYLISGLSFKDGMNALLECISNESNQYIEPSFCPATKSVSFYLKNKENPTEWLIFAPIATVRPMVDGTEYGWQLFHYETNQ